MTYIEDWYGHGYDKGYDEGYEDERARILALCEHYNIGQGHRLVKAIVSGEDVRDE